MQKRYEMVEVITLWERNMWFSPYNPTWVNTEHGPAFALPVMYSSSFDIEGAIEVMNYGNED
jgi:hypothetical protein